MSAMKKTITYIYTILLFTAVLGVGCDSYEDEEAAGLSETQEQLDRLAGSWNGDRVTFEGVDVTAQDFIGFTLTFNEDGTWSSQNGDPTFGSNGVWEFDGTNLSRILMNDVPVNLIFTYDGSQLTLEFTLVGSSIGRMKGVTGDYVINLSPLEQN